MARKNPGRRRARESSSRERMLAFVRALFRRGERDEIAAPPDDPPLASADVVAVPRGPPSAGSAEAVPDTEDA